MISYIAQPFPFYDAKERQLFRRTACTPAYRQRVLFAYDDGAPGNIQFILPLFQIRRVTGPGSVSSFLLKNGDTDATVATFTTGTFSENEIITGFETAVHEKEVQSVTATVSENQVYYFVVGDGTNTWYSEGFYLAAAADSAAEFPDSCEALIKLKWKNTCQISDTIFPANEYFEALLETDPCHPNYDLIEEGDNNAKGTFEPSLTRLEKTYQLELRGTECTADMLAVTAMFDDVQILYPDGDTIEGMNSGKVDVSWDGCFATITYKFKYNFLVKTACC